MTNKSLAAATACGTPRVASSADDSLRAELQKTRVSLLLLGALNLYPNSAERVADSIMHYCLFCASSCHLIIAQLARQRTTLAVRRQRFNCRLLRPLHIQLCQVSVEDQARHAFRNSGDPEPTVAVTLVPDARQRKTARRDSTALAFDSQALSIFVFSLTSLPSVDYVSFRAYLASLEDGLRQAGKKYKVLIRRDRTASCSREMLSVRDGVVNIKRIITIMYNHSDRVT